MDGIELLFGSEVKIDKTGTYKVPNCFACKEKAAIIKELVEALENVTAYARDQGCELAWVDNLIAKYKRQEV